LALFQEGNPRAAFGQEVRGGAPDDPAADHDDVWLPEARLSAHAHVRGRGCSQQPSSHHSPQPGVNVGVVAGFTARDVTVRAISDQTPETPIDAAPGCTLDYGHHCAG